MINLSERLNTIAKMCSGYKRIADVGCDHGKVLGYLAENSNPEFLVATDISAPSVKKAENLLIEIKYNNFSVRVGNGVDTLTNNDNLDLVVIAGMGGNEIISVLSNSTIKLPDLILQPQNNVVKLRKYLNDNNFTIIKDVVIFEREQFYFILKVISGTQKLTDLQINYGVFYTDFAPELINNLKFKLNKLENRKKLLTNEGYMLEINNEIAEINQILKLK